MTRRGLFATLAAPFIAWLLPKPKLAVPLSVPPTLSPDLCAALHESFNRKRAAGFRPNIKVDSIGRIKAIDYFEADQKRYEEFMAYLQSPQPKRISHHYDEFRFPITILDIKEPV